MAMIVQDWKENPIKVGTRVLYGCPDPGEFSRHTATVIGISDPDIWETDDGRVTDYYVEISLAFSDGTVEKARASIITAAGWWYEGVNSAEVFEESGDVEVLA